jgi:hypothetical protein
VDSSNKWALRIWVVTFVAMCLLIGGPLVLMALFSSGTDF